MALAFGDERWNSFMTRLAEKDKYFKNVIMSITLIPVEKLIVIFDEMCKEFYNSDYSQYSMFGKVGARVALSPEGPYKSYLLSKDLKQFVDFVLPKLWSTYFDGGYVPQNLRTTSFISKSPGFKSNIFTSSNSLWVTFNSPSKFSERKVLRNRSEAFHRAMKIFISSMH
jgi:hypothetical protein